MADTPRLRLATFNVENLMSRFDFEGVRHAHRLDRATALYDISDKGRLKAIEQARMIALTDDTRQLTALAIADCEPDVLCLQEVENDEALAAFERGYLFRMNGSGFRQRHVMPGNDGRGINVAVAAKCQSTSGHDIEVSAVTSHREATYGDMGLLDDELRGRGAEPTDRVFRRDCLEVDLRIGGRPLTVYICHFKSMGPNRDGMDGRTYSMPVRRAEARAVRKIIERRFEGRADRMNWIVCGDLNAYREKIEVTGSKRRGLGFKPVAEESSGIDDLFEGGFAEDLLGRLDPMERWTLFHSRGADEQHLCQLDYFLASPNLAQKNKKVLPEIIRNGQPFRTLMPEGQAADRYPRTGWDRPKASDHCPVVVELSL
ncbi:MAG: endonuclease/exonuclease/phosphatase family protein [Pseudomonadota bacterium]